MLASVVLMLLTQVAVCTPAETSVVCSCKQGMVTACVTLAGQDALKAAQVLDEVEEALEQASPREGDDNE